MSPRLRKSSLTEPTCPDQGFSGGGHYRNYGPKTRARLSGRNPLHWIDRVLRMTLGIPAYIVSLLAGVPRYRVEASAFGPVLRFIAVLADVSGAFALGKLLGLY